MFYLDGISLSKIKNELKENLLNKKVGKIFQNSSLSLTLHFGKTKLFFSCNPSFPICYINEDKEENFLEETSNFLLLIRKHLINGAVLNIEQLGYDRILKFTFAKINELGEVKKNYLYFEIMGKHSNIILTDENEEILSVIKRKSLEENSIRTLFVGETYTKPVVTLKKNPGEVTKEEFETYMTSGNILENIEGFGKMTVSRIFSYEDMKNILESNISPKIYFKNDVPVLGTVMEIEPKDYDEIKTYESFSEMINTYIKLKSLSNSHTLLKNKLNSVVEKEIKKSNKILKNIEKDIETMSNHEETKNLGDILASVLYSVKRGDKSVKAYDFYKNEEIVIPLDNLLSPQSNLEKIYKKSSKMKRGLEFSKSRLIEFKNKIMYLESVVTFLDNSESLDELKNIEEELIEGRYIRAKQGKKPKKKALVIPYGIIEIDGKQIYYGRNNKENDYLTYKFARRDDVWFHIKDLPGSHIIVKAEDFIDSENFIESIAKIAAFYSRANKGDKVVIDYTPKKNLSKPKGSPLGFVIYNVWEAITVVVPHSI